MQGEVPALCTQARGAVKCPGGKLGRGRGAGRSPLTCRRGSEGKQEPSDPRGRLQRQAACSPCGSLVSRVRRPPARSEVPRGHGTNGCQGTRGSPVHQDRPSTTVHRWSPRRRRHRVQLEKERSESTLKKKTKTKQNRTDRRRSASQMFPGATPWVVRSRRAQARGEGRPRPKVKEEGEMGGK